MSDLLVVVPEGWTDVTEGWQASSGNMTEIAPMFTDGNWVDAQYALQGCDINPPPGKALTGATFVLLGDGVHLWVRWE
jgi:hypothetical protein